MTIASKKPLVVALGAAFALTGAVAQASVFQASDLGTGYMLAQADTSAPAAATTPAPTPKQDKKSSELKCGEHKPAKGKAATAGDGKPAEGKCGEGKCGEGKCGQMKKK